MFPALCVEHSKICRDFSKKLAICIFGCPKLYLGGKKLMKFPQISSKISRWFLKEFLKKNPKGPPYENRKKISSIFFVQDIAWDIQKCLLEVFLKNLYILWYAPHIRLGTFWGHKPFWIIGNRFLTKSTYIKWYLVVKIKNSKVYPWGTNQYEWKWYMVPKRNSVFSTI